MEYRVNTFTGEVLTYEEWDKAREMYKHTWPWDGLEKIDIEEDKIDAYKDSLYFIYEERRNKLESFDNVMMWGSAYVKDPTRILKLVPKPI